MRPQVPALCATYLLCFLYPATFQTQEVCLGTKNGLSFTDSYAQHYHNLKERYIGCEIILGNLEINLMERDFDFSFLGSIREVTGYVLIATNQFSRLPLEQLRVIRGSSLYEKAWALSILVNYEGQHGLVTLGLTHLTEILEGGVQIVNNKFLTYGPWINWQDIMRDSSARTEIYKNGQRAPCHADCKDHCWGPTKEECQTMTKTVCAPQCHGRCFGTSPQDCCDIECAGGCTGPLSTDCFACRHVNHSGACVPHCPQPLIYNRQTFQLEPNPDAMYQYGSICMHKCPNHFVVDGSACVSSCPPEKMEVERNEIKQCELCNGLCPKVCEGTDPEKPDRQTVDSSNIDSFINCTEIQGSLHFLTTGIKGDSYNNIPPLDPQKLKIFSTVREITGVLNIQSWPEELGNLSSFSNLATIRGRSLKQHFSLLVMKVNSLTSLGLRSLREISDGSVYIYNNTNLCYHHTVDWTQIFRTSEHQSRRITDIKYNKPLNECEAEGCVCDPLCSSAGCWGPGPEQCLSCRNHSRHGTCVAKCNIYTGEPREFAEFDGECRACHTECLPQQGRATCRGQGTDECVACSNLMDGPHCVSACPNGLNGERGQAIFKYPNATGHCKPCHPNCTRGCKGPNLRDCVDPDRAEHSPAVAVVVFGVLAGLIVCLVVVVLSLLYHRGLAIRRKRALRRYLESGESIEPLDPGEKYRKVHARILRASELRKSKALGSGVFGTVHKGVWIPEGDSVKIPVAIKTIQDRSGRQTFTEITDHMLAMGSLDHQYIVRLLGICPGPSLQLVTQLSTQGSLLQHLRQNAHSLDPQRLLNWCVQIAKGMFYLEEHRMVHRNLAARNVLLKSDYIVQISDFGVADLLYPDKKYIYCEHKTPIKWMALESILFRRYSHQSDVWSYGVTVWEMMSNGAEPYAAMHPHDVPGLLEKGERLAQPQICTIDVYMVMVKCWMIDENVRPTFKELANEFTRMARDPPRYLVVKSHRNSVVPDESHPRELKLAEVHLESDDEEVLDDELATPPLHLSPSRSHSRLRIGSYRSSSGQSVPVGYLPMTPSPGDDPRQLWAQRRSLGSARTASESSEGRSTMADLDLSEITSQKGSLRRGRSRIDSAYMSNSTSVVSDPFSPGTEVSEEDPDGYVLPQSIHSSERDALVLEPGSGVRMLKAGSGSSLPRSRPPRNTWTHLPPLVPIADPTQESQEYELMNRQPTTLPYTPRDSTDAPSSVLKQSSSLSPEEGSGFADTQKPVQCKDAHSEDPAVHEDGPVPVERDGEGKQCEWEPSEDTAEDGPAAVEGLPQQPVVEYEYMDIRTEPKPEQVSTGSLAEKNNTSNSLCEVKREAKEDAIYQNTCELPALNGNANTRASFRETAVSGQLEEYEDMGACGIAHMSHEQLVYQNIPSKGMLVSGEELPGAKLMAFRGVCAGVDDKGSTSFDNPDYWHSRLFHKPDAVCT